MSGRVLVTGATGFIGGMLADRLAAEGYQVRCLRRSKTSRVEQGGLSDAHPALKQEHFAALRKQRSDRGHLALALEQLLHCTTLRRITPPDTPI
jgi:nucleoside-diphosphate-sugar epimerase